MDNLSYNDYTDKPRFELIDNKVVMMSPQPRIDHNRVCTNIVREFSLKLKGKTCEAFGDGVDLYLDKKNHFIPDVMIVCNPSIVKDYYIAGAPDLVVEVLSRSTAQNDRTKKKDAYEAAGVKEYWIVDIMNKAVEVYLNKNAHFYLSKIYYYYSEVEIAANDALPEDDRYKIKNIDREICLSIGDAFSVELKDIFDRV